VALYVHVPFCVSLCPYCDFVVNAGAAARGPTSRVTAFLEALAVELDLRADALDERFGRGRPPLETVYLGGGTPSLLPADAVHGLLDRVRARFGLADTAEVTIEANPGPDERGDARQLRAAGVTRISLGAQSLADPELRQLGRRHRVGDVADAVAAARDGGITSVSLDLLYDIPGSSVASWAATLESALALEPDHLSLYALTLDDPDAEGLTGIFGDHLPTTAGARRWRERARPRQDDDRAAEQYLLAAERLSADGWRSYEISNWARPGHESRHNLAYWQRRPYEAVGPGAHAFDGATRRWNAARLDGYVATLAPPGGAMARLPPGGSEIIDPEMAQAEEAILGLRTAQGIPLQLARTPRFEGPLAWGTEHGLVRESNGHVSLTSRGRLLSNELFAKLL
jgi:putative oxygen-independent coproporphyrinogen III oxidase